MITSTQNQSIKNIIKLSKSKERQEQNLFVIEGARELSLALQGGYEVESVYVCYELFKDSKYPNVLDGIADKNVFEIAPNVFERIAYRVNSDGLVALAKPKRHYLSDLHVGNNPFIIVLESVEKPGNLGAILRTADAAGVDAVLICDPKTDLYNPNVIRSGVGGLFTVKTVICTSSEALDWLKNRGINVYAAELEASERYDKVDFMKPSAIVMGTEADGLTSFWKDNATKRIIIPMGGKIDSLNVSTSTAIITFEAMRQRGFSEGE